jgi:hypothetical protein
LTGSRGRLQFSEDWLIQELFAFRALWMVTTSTTGGPGLAVSTPRSKRSLTRRVLRAAFIALLAAATVPAGLLSRPFFEGNVGVVDPGRVIRAAQPTSGLSGLIKDYHLASILDLRGGSFRDSWYSAEVQMADSSGVLFFDLPLSATQRPSRRELLLLIDLFDRCPYPLLIHCKAGADRTGLASAVYLMMRRGEPPQQAEGAFTLFHSHVPLFGPQHLHEPLDEYTRWLETRSLPHTPERFREWVKNEYRSPDPHIDPAPLAAGPRKHRG